MVAKPSAYLGKSLKLNRPEGSATSSGCYEAKLDDSNIREAVLQTTGLCINSGLWTGISGYCRFTVALEEAEFTKALECIVNFKRLVLGN